MAGEAQVGDLLPLLGRFLGRERAANAFDDYARLAGRESGGPAGRCRAGALCRTTLAGAIGSASARVIVASVVQEEPLGLDEVMNILNEASPGAGPTPGAWSRSPSSWNRRPASCAAPTSVSRELDRLKDDFMSSVTHELRTPLTSIRAFSEMLLEDPEIDVDDRQRFLGIIVSETERLTRLVKPGARHGQDRIGAR